MSCDDINLALYAYFFRKTIDIKFYCMSNTYIIIESMHIILNDSNNIRKLYNII